MTRIAVASGSELAARAGARIADLGGNAVDAGIAAVMVSAVTEPGLCGLGGSGAITIWAPGEDPQTIEGAPEMPGRGLPPDRFGGGLHEVQLAYGKGTPTLVGLGSIATPGMVAACGEAWRRYARLPWRELLQPAFEHARDGFALPGGSAAFLAQTESIYARDPEALAPFRRADGEVREAGEHVQIPHLADTFATIAERGAELFYTGELAERIAAHIRGGGGLLGVEDLARYEARALPSVQAKVGPWRYASYPPPAIGGATLLAMLSQMEGHPGQAGWTSEEVDHLVEVQRRVFRFRRERLDASEDLEADVAALLAGAPHTVHSSALDAEGLGCAVTMSNGYGSGVVPPGTGVYFNNSLGEIELNRRGVHAFPIGSRLLSNMAPTIARRDDGAVLVIGSPGADRITSAILQATVGFAHAGLSLDDAIRHPRAHVECLEHGDRVAHEAGMPVTAAETRRRFEGLDLFFGGVAAVYLDPNGSFELSADPRRAGGTALGGH